MAAQLFYVPFDPVFNSRGLFAGAARAYFYLSGTTTLAPVYADAAFTTALPNPVVADALGQLPAIYLDDTKVYRLRLTDRLGVQIGNDYDPYVPGKERIGPTGPADNTYTSLVAFRASDTNRRTASLVGVPGVSDGRFNWTDGDYSGQADDANIIKADDTPLSVGAWVRQGAAGISYVTPVTSRDSQAKLNDVTRTIFDVVKPSELLAFATGVTPIDTFLARMVAIGGTWRLPYRSFVYKMTQRVTSGIQNGFTLLGDDRVVVEYSGPGAQGVSDFNRGLFEATDVDDFTIACTQPGGTFTFRCLTAGSVHLWVQHCRGRCRRPSIADVRGEECHLQYCTSSSDTVWENIVLYGEGANCCSDARATRVSSYFAAKPFGGEGAVMWYYVDGGRASYVDGYQCGSAVQAWGGNAAYEFNGTPSSDPAVEAKRLKCRNIYVDNVTAYNTANTWVFFCMVDYARCSDSKGEKALDVGFDAEGCRDVLWSRCTGKDATNANYAVFFWSDNVRMVDCTTILSNGFTARHVHLTNPTQLSFLSGGYSWQGGAAICLDGSFGLFTADAAMEVCVKDCEMVQSAVWILAEKGFRVRIEGNTVRLPRQVLINPQGYYDIFFVDRQQGANGMSPEVTISNNSVFSDVVQTLAVGLVRVVARAVSAPVLAEVFGNRGFVKLQQGGFAGMRFEQQIATDAMRLMLESNSFNGDAVVVRGGTSGSPYPAPVVTLGPVGTVNVAAASQPADNRALAINSNTTSDGMAVNIVTQMPS